MAVVYPEVFLLATISLMNEELTVEEACRSRVMTDEDFARSCNPDGTVKSGNQTTTFTLKNDPTKSVTVNNRVAQTMMISTAILLLAVLGFLIYRAVKK